MTDEFEELIRSAGRGLGAAGETPTYHGAWQRGQRRRVVKRASMAAAGACALVLAFSASVGQFNQDRSVEVSEVATNAVEVAPTSLPPTTEPVLAGPLEDLVAPDLDLSPNPVPAGPGAADDGLTTEDLPDEDLADLAPETRPTIVIPIPVEAPSSVDVVELPPPSPTETAVVPDATATLVPTPVPTNTPQPSIAAGSTGSPATTFDSPDATDSTDAADSSGTTTADDGSGNADNGGEVDGGTDATTGAGTTTGDTDETTAGDSARAGTASDATATATPEPSPTSLRRGDLPGDSPSPPAVGPVRLVDAIILTELTAGEAGSFACDTDFDGVADATCWVLTPYPCSSAGEATRGYVALDTSGDGALDTCLAAVDTWCRISLNGANSRVECLIRVDR